MQYPLGPWLLCIVICTSSAAYTQALDKSPFPEIRITISQRQFNTLQSSKGAKLNLKNATMTVNGDSARINDVHLRGNNTLNFKRKSMSVELDKSIQVKIGEQTVSLKKFHLLNLAMDKNLWHNRWSYLMMSQLGIFPPFNSYCTVMINDKSQGIYLLVEKPQHSSAAMNSPYTIRRGENHVIDNDYDDTKSKEEAKNYKKQYYSLYENSSLKGESLYQHINGALNMQQYFKWLAFNYLIMNGDYADELFLFINPDTKLYEVIAWDYDDLFMVSPHEGRVVRNQNFKERMIFSTEDDFDKTIVADDYVYSKYELSLKELLHTCDSSMLATTSQKVLEELVVLSRNEENCKSTFYLDKEPFEIESAKYDIEKSIAYLQSRRSLVLKELEQAQKD